MSKREEAIAESHRLAVEISEVCDRPTILMEVCGTHAHQFARYGLAQLLPDHLQLLSGPGCPVCVTSASEIDAALMLARLSDVTVATFGDMMRVPGSDSTLSREKARGADVRVVASPIEAVALAERTEHQVILIGIGFETTTPGVAVAVREAKRRGLSNFTLLCAGKRLIPALDALMAAEDVSLDGLLGPGHVSTIIGAGAYREFVMRHRVPCVIAGFEPVQMLRAVLALTRQLRDGRAEVQNVYRGAVGEEGNTKALAAIDEVFEPADAEWRGLGVIQAGGLRLRERYTQFDALTRFEIDPPDSREHAECCCGEVLRGATRPQECCAFGIACIPENPLGPCMVSSEGACAAAYRYEA